MLMCCPYIKINICDVFWRNMQICGHISKMVNEVPKGGPGRHKTWAHLQLGKQSVRPVGARAAALPCSDKFEFESSRTPTARGRRELDSEPHRHYLH